MARTASVTRRGSSSSNHDGRPVLTEQKPQARVQVSPSSMKVAVPRLQHSPRLGQRASSQTVFRRLRVTDCRVRANWVSSPRVWRIQRGMRPALGNAE